ncbi:MAG: peroxiredoxin [Pseudomonadota bacterium]
MTISVGDQVPAATFREMTDDGPADIDGASFFAGRKIALFAVPGAYTPTCHVNHMPSFVNNANALRAHGVDEIACVAVNDPFVMKQWGADTGATAAGIRLLSDADAAFTKALGLEFTAPPVGLIDRSKRYSMLIEDGKVTQLNVEDNPGVCEVSGGDKLLAQI